MRTTLFLAAALCGAAMYAGNSARDTHDPTHVAAIAAPLDPDARDVAIGEPSKDFSQPAVAPARTVGMEIRSVPAIAIGTSPEVLEVARGSESGPTAEHMQRFDAAMLNVRPNETSRALEKPKKMPEQTYRVVFVRRPRREFAMFDADPHVRC